VFKVPDHELRAILENWLLKLVKVRVLQEERDKHIRKLKEVLKRGW